MTTESSQQQPVIDIDARLSLEDEFRFDCGPHVPCFTECCQKLELLLTPYDVLRLKKRLGLTSARFLDDWTIVRHQTAHGFPEVLLKMDLEHDKRCPFVTEKGCSIYEDRPGACRTYPLGRASTTHRYDDSHREFYFTVREAHCRGFEIDRNWTVREWIADQGLEEFNRINDMLMELLVLKQRGKGATIGPQHIQMYMMACYNTEKFREFLFNSPFFQKFEVEKETLEQLRHDDVALLEFAFRWLSFALFQQPVMKIRDDVNL